MAKNSISRTIVPQPDGALEIRGRKYDGSRNTETMSEMFTPIPSKPYRVTYLISDQGEFQVYCGFGPSMSIRRVGKYCGKIVCFIPQSWHGQKVNRLVEVLK